MRDCREFIEVSRQREKLPRGLAALWIICVQSLLGGAAGVADPGVHLLFTLTFLY
jgi:hypothetical protein